MSHRISLVAVGATLGLIVALPSARAATVEHVQLWDKDGTMGITLDHPQVLAGKVAFEATNTSQYLVHEMIVLKVPGKSYEPPYDQKTARIYEDKVKDLGEVSELEPGKAGSLILQLEPGLYELVCNQPGHYMNGMHAFLTVTAPPKPAKSGATS